MYRTRKNDSIYQKFKKEYKNVNDCTLCNLDSNIIINKAKNYTIIKNKFPYDYWENRRVLDHLMIVPKHHSPNLKSIPKNIRAQIFNIVLDYENNGYDIYLRGLGSSSRSVASHAHIHLIKTKDKIANINISIEKPYFVFVK